jgi:exopolysaccharide biosynthesis polyprenyl glycosylphosphotransferase
MATSATSEMGPMGAIEIDTGGTAAALPRSVSLGRGHAQLGAARPHDQRGRLLRRLLLAADVAALCTAFVITEGLFGAYRSVDIPLLLVSIPLFVGLAYGHRLYHLDSHRADYRASDEIGPVLQMATMWSWSLLLALALLRPGDIPVGRIALFWLLTVILMMALRSGARAFARRQVWYLQNALVLGPPGQAAAIVRKILRHPEWGIHATACVDLRGSTRFPARNTPPFDLVPLLRGYTDLVALVEQLDIDRVMLAPAVSESSRRAEIVCELSELGVHVDLIPSWSDVVGARLDLHEIEGTPLLTVPRPQLQRSSLWLKRGLDLAVSCLALVFLAPLLAVCAIAIKLDTPGPVLFRQRRVGRDDTPFEVFKFRSMCDGADVRKDEVAQLNLHGGGTATGMFKIREDPRVTRVGSILRRYSLDELPQLLNIVRGEMSLVGPRPLIENEDRQVEGRYRRRLGLKPGLTGLWQANGRSEIPFQEMVSLDYLYVTNWSLWGDVKVLMRTFSTVFRGRGAY